MSDQAEQIPPPAFVCIECVTRSCQTHRSPLSRCRGDQESGRAWPRLVGDEHRAALERIYADELQVGATVQVLEQTPALIDDNRMNEQSILVDESGIRQRLHQCRAAERDDVAGEPRFTDYRS